MMIVSAFQLHKTCGKKENIDNIDVHAFGVQETDTLIMPSAVIDPTELK